MPWTTDEDVQKHNKHLGKNLMKKWRAIANGIYKDCLANGGDDKKCSGKAIRIANSRFERGAKRIK
jgi:hypothetical protein